MKTFPLIIFLLLALISAGQLKPGNCRQQVDLQGEWLFKLDSADAGISEKWYLNEFDDLVALPGTTDSNRKGFLNRDITTMHLSRIYTYEGVAWYRKKISIPASFSNKHITLFLERTKCTQIWIDDQLVGSSRLLQSPQVFDLSAQCAPGEHTITISVDNRLKNTPYGNVHIYSDDTQTNWNGIIGKMYIEASDPSYITDLQVFTDPENQKINISLGVENHMKMKDLDFEISVGKIIDDSIYDLKYVLVRKPSAPQVMLEYNLGAASELWDEFHQPLYKLTVTMKAGGYCDSKSVNFGMRKFEAQGTQFAINGRTTFLRGKHDACVFPLTGHPPMDKAGWERVFTIAKSYGINHYRFHTWCPPEAAFAAADKLGIYIQAELPFWGALDLDTIAAMLLLEGMSMLKAYANHPSLVMFSFGNEIWGGQERVEKNIQELKKYDKRVLYCTGSNNNIGYIMPPACEDFHVAARTPSAGDTILTHTRLTHAFADSKNGGMLNTLYPGSETDYSYAVSQLKIPLISHETGQYQVYPDFNEINKYAGVLQPRNLVIFRERLSKSGMADQDLDLHKASGAWAAICYKAEMETALRTPGMAGFQLLDLQDYPGQGTALVGMLDAFMDSKEVVSHNEWLHSCSSVALLLRLPKFCFSNDECLNARLEIANYSAHDISKRLVWKIQDRKGKLLARGSAGRHTIKCGGLRKAGTIQFDFSKIKHAEQLKIVISVKGTQISNSYNIWVYPKITSLPEKNDIVIVNRLTDNVIQTLGEGAKVLLFPLVEDVKQNSVPGLFPPDFWNYGMFKGISEWVKKTVSPGTLGILTNPDHPVFNAFPTDNHTNWQWFSIIKVSSPLILDSTATGYRPIVQVIDNMERNHKLGLIFEFRVGSGKLLVCMSHLPEIMDKPEGRQLYESILNFMNSIDFDPVHQISAQTLRSLLGLR